MNISEYIKSLYPSVIDEIFINGTILLQNDGKGDYVKEWNCIEKIPDDLKSKTIYKG